MSLEWDYPAQITNAIFDFNEISYYTGEKLIKELDSLNCEAIQLRFYFSPNIKIIEKICNDINNSNIHSIEILLRYERELNIQQSIDIIENNEKIRQIIFYNYINDCIIHTTETDCLIYGTTKIINTAEHCGIIDKDYFTCNLETITEAINYNSCLNRKISIDVNGEIKNCPSMKKSYGNIKNTTLEEALNKPGFKDLWFITKDQIEVCKDCEFRYICTDCRAFIENENNIYSKPAKCKYNPYTNEGFDL